MSTIATETELKQFIDDRYITINNLTTFTDEGLRQIFYKFAETVNASKQGYKMFKSIVHSERFSTTESINIGSNSDKFIELENTDFGSVTVARQGLGQYRVTTSYNDANTVNLLTNGLINIQPLKDIPENNILRSGDTTFVGSDVSISTKATYISPGVFDIYLVASRSTENENLVDANFYLTIELFNFPTT